MNIIRGNRLKLKFSIIIVTNKDDNIIKKNIEERNDSFFLNHNTLFENVIDKTKIIHFKKIWRSPQLDQEDKETIWKWVDSFVFLSDKYAKNKTS